MAGAKVGSPTAQRSNSRTAMGNAWESLDLTSNLLSCVSRSIRERLRKNLGGRSVNTRGRSRRSVRLDTLFRTSRLERKMMGNWWASRKSKVEKSSGFDWIWWASPLVISIVKFTCLSITCLSNRKDAFSSRNPYDLNFSKTLKSNTAVTYNHVTWV